MRASRIVAVAGIIVLHAAVVAAGLLVKGPTVETSAEAPALQIVMFDEPEAAPPPSALAQPVEIAPPQVVMPIVDIALPTTPTQTITVAAPSAVHAPAVPLSPPEVVAAASDDGDSPITIAEAQWIRMPSPVYPAAAKKARAQGQVLVRALVDEAGHAVKASVHRSSGFTALDRAACDSVLAALFRPYLHNGMPRRVDVIVPVTFELTGRRGGRDDRG